MHFVYRINNLLKLRKGEGIEFRLVVPELKIRAGEKIALVGPSGCGKSTLLDMLAMVLSPSRVGTFRLNPDSNNSKDIARYWSHNKFNKLSTLRKYHIGYVLQTGGLLPFITVRHNIGLSCRLLSLDCKQEIESIAARLGIKHQLDKLPAMLSVGERQRVAIARALIHRPSIIIADEPTASLDPTTAQRIMGLLIELTDELGLTMIVASHDVKLLEELGLRQLNHNINNSPSGSAIESVFTE
ncbi:MAG: ABC transporter ATP-binding protein [Pseudomonadota bacterium]